MESHDLYFIVGCTAVGKTAFSITFAQKFNLEILSCDSVQVYKNANIGSAKITEQEMQNIKHYGLDICEPTENYNVGNYISYAKNVIQAIKNRNKKVLIVGGTGLYLQSFFQPVIDDLHIPIAIKADVENIYNFHGIQGLQREILTYGDVNLNNSDWNNARRLTKILEKCKLTGQSQVDINTHYKNQKSEFENYKKYVIELYRSDENLLERAKIRIDQMISDGLIDEVKSFGNDTCSSIKNAIGYRETFQYLCGEITSLDSLKLTIFQNTKKLIKKQKTWFRTQLPIDMRVNLDNLNNIPGDESFDFMEIFS